MYVWMKKMIRYVCISSQLLKELVLYYETFLSENIGVKASQMTAFGNAAQLMCPEIRVTQKLSGLVISCAACLEVRVNRTIVSCYAANFLRIF
jgi:hypothetical protein